MAIIQMSPDNSAENAADFTAGSVTECIPTYFGDKCYFGMYNLPAKQSSIKTVALVCKPIGFEGVHAHRSMRELAEKLADKGIPTLRFDYHGTGNSQGTDADPGRVKAWQQSIAAAVEELRSRFNAENVCLIGIRLGGTLAATVAEKAGIDKLVLWSPCLKGASFVRDAERLAKSALNDNEVIDPSGQIDAAGHILTKETCTDLSKIDLMATIPPTKIQYLILDRNELPICAKLHDKYTESGLDSTYEKYKGYTKMVARPHYAVVPEDAISTIISWLEKTSANSTEVPLKQIKGVVQQAKLPIDYYSSASSQYKKGEVIERACKFGKEKSLFGVITEPSSGVDSGMPIVIMLNAGAIYHIGPHRLHVLLSRDLSYDGFTSFRMDIHGLGDSTNANINPECHPYSFHGLDDLREALEFLQGEYDNPSFIILGLCAGGYFSFHAGLTLDEYPVKECLLINPLDFYWQDGMPLDAPPPTTVHFVLAGGYKKSLFKLERWKLLLTGQTPILPIFKTVVERIVIVCRAQARNLQMLIPLSMMEQRVEMLPLDIRRIIGRGIKMSFFFTDTDPGYALLKTEANLIVKKGKRTEQIALYVFGDADHTFTRQPARLRLMNTIIDHLKRRYA